MVAGSLINHRIQSNQKGYRYCHIIEGEQRAYKCFTWFSDNANGRWAWQHTPWRSESKQEYLIFLDDDKDITLFHLMY